MKKKNLIVLLLMPFIIATLCIVTVNITYDAVDVDISFIEWDYKDFEPFSIDTSTHKLNAKGVNRNNYKLADGNELVWTVENKDGSETPYAEIVKIGGDYYLKPMEEGEVIITCSTEKGNVSRRMTGIIYKDAVIVFQPAISGSQANVDQTVYYGQYDLNGGSKQGANVEMSLVTLPESILSTITATTTDNISFDISTKKISILGTGTATVTLQSEAAKSVSYTFEIVENGVNVYTYEDLLNCTNRSKQGEIVVLRKHFESVENAYIKTGTSLTLKENNVACFGNYNARTDKYTFDKEVYSFETTFNRNYIDQWNQFASSNNKYSTITSKVIAGLHVQKDFYGNGYTINLHNLTFPYDEQGGGTSSQTIPMLREDNLFRGPLPFYTLGDPNALPLVSALGQDNVGMYVHGNGIVINDVNVKNCDFGDRIANLDTVGTVMEIDGDNITVKNSRLSNGKTVLRAYSSYDFLLKNCMLTNSRNFLLSTGANEYIPVDGKKVYELLTEEGGSISSSIDDYLAKEGGGDTALSNFLITDYTADKQLRNNIENLLHVLHDALNDGSVEGIFKGSTVVEDCLFEKAGISAISVDSMFNGPYLYNASPSLIYDAFAGGSMTNGISIVPYTATNVSGTSYPVELTIKGKTRFYDYKTASQLDLSGLITENISTIANMLVSNAGLQITIDDIFPLKGMMMQKAYNLNYDYASNGQNYVNLPVAYYGGGLNLSEVKVEGECAQHLSGKVDMDILSSYLDLKGGGFVLEPAPLRNLMMKTVTTVIGYEPFQFRFVEEGYLFGEHAQISQLIDNAKGEQS